jgi:hypothetical protein
MRIASSPTIRIATGLFLAALLSIVGYQVLRHRSSQAPEALLKRADDLSWLNAWVQAEPLYRQAELKFRAEGNLPRALYARVSQVPAESESSMTIPNEIASLRGDLELPEARNPDTRLRILTILGMLETNYDAGMARDTWTEVEKLAVDRQHYLLTECSGFIRDRCDGAAPAKRKAKCGEGREVVIILSYPWCRRGDVRSPAREAWPRGQLWRSRRFRNQR